MIISITLWAVTFWSCFYSPMAISQSLYSAVVVNSLKDSDNDGVINARDLCPDTPKDSDIDNDGCPVTELEYFSFNFDIQFQTASYKLNPEFLPRLKALVLFLQKSPNTLILIEGHTDNIGAESFNLALSKKRAEAIADALTSSFNISPERIKTFGYGQERPIASNDTETGRKKNRRVTGEIVTPFHFQQKQEDAQDKNSINPVSHSNKSELIIPFKRNHVGVKNSYQPSLQGLGEALQNTPDTLAIIEGYTDNSGSKNYNIQLSLKRAKRVAQLLSSEFAIPQDRLKVLGHGPSFPIASNDSAQGRAQNRRVSAQVVQKFKASKEVILPKWTIWSVDQLEQPKEKKN
ncbi:MAG: OmpA family protein [Oceanospirillaceae bacterium]|nr:OmpA family protein [Oceanospirillaceae bacterium]